MAQPKIAIIIYTLYGHIAKMAEAVKKGVEEAGGVAEIYQVAETLPDYVLDLYKAPPKPDYPVMSPLDMANGFDGYLFGVPTRFGRTPAQISQFFDTTGQIWAKGELVGKPVGFFVSTNTSPGGSETTVLNCLPWATHQGMVYVPLGFKATDGLLSKLDEVRGGSAWGAGTLAGENRNPSERELTIAQIQGKSFTDIAKKLAAP